MLAGGAAEGRGEMDLGRIRSLGVLRVVDGVEGLKQGLGIDSDDEGAGGDDSSGGKARTHSGERAGQSEDRHLQHPSEVARRCCLGRLAFSGDVGDV